MQIERLVGEAQACEEGEDIARALVLWRQVASLQPDIASLFSHLKVLEAKLHEQTIENSIEAGHRMRRGRHCFAAVDAYRRALRLLSATDPRVKPVGEALKDWGRRNRYAGAKDRTVESSASRLTDHDISVATRRLDEWQEELIARRNKG